MAYLEGNNLVASYGVVPILHECSVQVEKGELAVIVGPNGAGKSTVMRVLLGMLEATSGSVTLDGKDISMLSTQDRISHGLAFVPQTKNVFPSMTVEENLQMGGLSGILGHLNIADNVLIGAHTLITKSIDKPGNYVGIMPAQEHKDWAKSSVFIKQRKSK